MLRFPVISHCMTVLLYFDFFLLHEVYLGSFYFRVHSTNTHPNFTNKVSIIAIQVFKARIRSILNNQPLWNNGEAMDVSALAGEADYFHETT